MYVIAKEEVFNGEDSKSTVISPEFDTRIKANNWFIKNVRRENETIYLVKEVA